MYELRLDVSALYDIRDGKHARWPAEMSALQSPWSLAAPIMLSSVLTVSRPVGSRLRRSAENLEDVDKHRPVKVKNCYTGL